MTFVLYGVADRDPDELVCAFHKTRKDAASFADLFPGTYDILVVDGIDYDNIEIVDVIHPFRTG